MAVGQMGIVAPVTAVLAASLPVIVGAITQGLPSAIHLIGFVLALVGVFFISRPEGSAGKPTGLGYAFIGGLGFGAFFILIAQVRDNSVFWPLAAARAASVILMLAVVLVSRRFDRPDRRALNWILLSGVMDVCGNIFFVLAEQTGRLDIAGVLSSLYPATTVLLALVVLRDRLTRVQTIGVVLAMAAIPLIASR
jgi:drug/metabolite transporter (DMT)-like permease